MLIVLTTTPTSTEGEALAAKIVAAKLAACVQIMPQMTSIYVWEGEMKKESEHLLLIKTLPEKYDDLEAFIKANHSYTLPEITAINDERISHEYARWLAGVLAGP